MFLVIFYPLKCVFYKNFEGFWKNAKKFRLGRGLNLRPLESTKSELPSYPLGHAAPDFFYDVGEMDYKDKNQ